jgi:hypothetical protein
LIVESGGHDVAGVLQQFSQRPEDQHGSQILRQLADRPVQSVASFTLGEASVRWRCGRVPNSCFSRDRFGSRAAGGLGAVLGVELLSKARLPLTRKFAQARSMTLVNR